MSWRLALFICPLLLTAHVNAVESWRAIKSDSPNVLFMVDEAGLVREGELVKFHERYVYVQPERRDAASGKLVKEKRVLRVMNCVEKTQAHLFGSLIADDGRQIEAVTIDPKQVKMKPIPAGTLAARELAWACAAKPPGNGK